MEEYYADVESTFMDVFSIVIGKMVKCLQMTTNKGKKMSEETKIKMYKGKHWFNNGVTSIRAFKCPPLFVQGRLNRR